MTDKILKKLNGEYTRTLIRCEYLHKVILNSDDFRKIFEVEKKPTRWEFGGWSSSYHRGEDGRTTIHAFKGKKEIFSKYWDEPCYGYDQTKDMENLIKTYVYRDLGLEDAEDGYVNLSRKPTNDKLATVSWTEKEYLGD